MFKKERNRTVKVERVNDVTDFPEAIGRKIQKVQTRNRRETYHTYASTKHFQYLKKTVFKKTSEENRKTSPLLKLVASAN